MVRELCGAVRASQSLDARAGQRPLPRDQLRVQRPEVRGEAARQVAGGIQIGGGGVRVRERDGDHGIPRGDEATRLLSPRLAPVIGAGPPSRTISCTS